MKTNDLQTEITHGEVEEAMKSFFERGGKIKTLPEQRSSSIIVTGHGKWSVYEPIRELYF